MTGFLAINLCWQQKENNIIQKIEFPVILVLDNIRYDIDSKRFRWDSCLRAM